MLKSKFFQVVIIFCFIAAAGSAAFADTIRLKDGSVIKGRIVGFREGQFVVQIGDGSRARQMTFFSDEIDAIEFDSAGSSSAARTDNSTSPVLPSRPNILPTVQPNNGNAANNVIVVGRKDTVPQTTPTPAPTPAMVQIPAPTAAPVSTPIPTASPVARSSATPSNPQPIRLNLKVLADNTSNGWTNAGWVVRKGQKIKIISTGRVSLGKGNYATPIGISSLADKDKLMQNQPTGELIAVIGDDNNDFIPIGTSKEFTATRDGALFLGINEGNLDDNSGAFEITVEIDPGIGN